MSSHAPLQFALEDRAESDRARMKAQRDGMSVTDAISVLSGNTQLMSLVQERLGHHTVVEGHHGKKNLRRHSGDSDSDGDGADKAAKMLNEMIEEAMKKLDAERVRCSEFEMKMTQLMEESQQAIAAFNAASAKARGEIMEANAQIEVLSYRIAAVEDSLSILLKNCAIADAEFVHQLSIIADDVEIMGQLAEKSACKGHTGSIAAPAFLQCQNNDGESFLGFGHKVIREKVMQLKSESLRRGVQELLWEHAGGVDRTPVAPVSDNEMKSFVPDPYHLSFLQEEDDPAVTTTTPQKLSAKEQKKLDKKCSMSNNPNCQKINDKFLLMQSEVLETQSDMLMKRQKAQGECDSQEYNFKAQLNNLQARLKIQQTALARATEAQNEADEQSRLETINYLKLNKEYRKGMRECKTNIETHEAEECSLTKLRLEVFSKKQVVDCAVSSWQSKPCNKRCGGGIQRLKRKITAHPVGGGAACPALKMERSCNDHPCPIDCVLGSWGGWTTCSANCDGGVKSRNRPVETDAAHGGEPCGESAQAEQCNQQACNQPCTLGYWEPWSDCSQECGSGFKQRHRPVQDPAVGSGTCPDAESTDRLEMEVCNTQACPKPVLTTYQCNAKLDVLLLLDGSGSLGQQGWDATKKAGSMLASAMVGGADAMNLAVQLFSGPGTLQALYDCLGYTDATPNMETDCNVKWVQRLSPDTKGAAGIIENLEWPGRTTLTSAALAMAESELAYSRRDASSVVVVVTDGIPMSEDATYWAAYSLRQKARVMFIPVTKHAPISQIVWWASEPLRDNIIEVEDFLALEQPDVIDRIILDICPNAY